jgi:hypothetical protein
LGNFFLSQSLSGTSWRPDVPASFFFPISVNLQHDWSMVRVDCFRKALFGKKNDHMTSARQNPCHLVVLLMFPFSILSWSEFQLYGADCSHEQAGKPIVRSGSCQD